MTTGDLPAALELSSIVGWNQTAEDWRMLLDLAQGGCFGIEVDGRVVATATLLRHGMLLGWIGMVLTHPEYRGRGLAKQLVDQVLATADQIGILTLKLDATDQGKPLYQKYGFKNEQPVERWFRPPQPGSRAQASDAAFDVSKWSNLDASAFGADRSALLKVLGNRGKCLEGPDAYLLTRSGRTSAYIGPCVAKSLEAARDLLQQANRDAAAGGCIWDLLPANRNATALATELGFSSHRQLTRMSRGEGLRGKDELVYAIAGFELG